MDEPALTKCCSYCLETKLVTMFHRHPTALYKRKHVCKKCCSEYTKTNNAKKRAAAGKLPFVKKGGMVAEKSPHKRGYIREDGMVFFCCSKRKYGWQEWWITKEKFEQIRKRTRDIARSRYHNDPVYREKERISNCSERQRAAKRRWNKANRAHMDNYLAERRAKIRGNWVALTDEERKRAKEFYLFRDILNARHGKVMFEIDHVIPLSRNGKHHPDNLRVTTAVFNHRKFVNNLCPETHKKIASY